VTRYNSKGVVGFLVIIKTIALSSALATCPLPQAQPTMHALSVPVRQERSEHELPEKTEPPHGEGSGESPMFGGMAVYGNANVSNTASVMVHFGASGAQPYTSVARLPNRLPMIMSTHDFEIDLFAPPMPQRSTVQVAPHTTKHLNNPSTTRRQRAVTRQR
jgi:hypothetical protein